MKTTYNVKITDGRGKEIRNGILISIDGKKQIILTNYCNEEFLQDYIVTEDLEFKPTQSLIEYCEGGDEFQVKFPFGKIWNQEKNDYITI